MSSGGSSRVSIPSSLRKTIQDIKEIARNHSDDEILAMLEECNMDPNETAQKLLYQDTFHEVKRKRDRRKENLNNREPTDSRWKPGMQGWGSRGGRGSYYSRYQCHDAGGISVGMEDGVMQSTEKATTSPSPLSVQETQNKSGVLAAGSVPGIANAPTKVAHVSSSQGPGPQTSGGGGFPLGEESLSSSSTNTGCPLPPPVDTKNGPANRISVEHRQPTPMSDQFPSITETSDSGVSADSNALLVSSLDTHDTGFGHTIKFDMGSERTACNKVASHELSGSDMSRRRTSPEMVTTSIQGVTPTKSQVLEASHLSDASQPLSSAFQFGLPGSKPSSNFSSMSQAIGPQKVGPSKEWKPKSLSSIPVQVSVAIGTSDAAHVIVETNTQSVPVLNSGISEEGTSKLQKKLEELCFSDGQHVIIPNHLQVPEAERCGLSFGSFDASFGIGKGSALLNDADSEKFSAPPTESSQEAEDNSEELMLSTQIISLATQEEKYSEHPESSMPEMPTSKEGDKSLNNSAVPNFEQPKETSAVAQAGPQFSVVHTAPAYSAFGLVPPMLGCQHAPFESSETQAREASRVTSFIVQPPFDPSTGYYTQIYRPGADGDGRFSPFLAHGTTTKYSGNAAVLSSQTGQSTQESENSLALPNTGVATQAAGVLQTSVAVTQQPVPVFRQPAGVHISHYPPNYVPYGHYFSPFYVPTPTIHHFFSNTALPQQPLAGSIYPPPAAPATTPAKYPLSQYKSGTNGGNSNHAVMSTGHGPYSSGQTGYGPNPAVSSGNSTVNEVHTLSQYKENTVYMTGQQNEGSAVWLPVPGRDIPSLQAGSFYDLPQGQQMAFTPSQARNGAFAGIYHPTQSVGTPTVHPMLQQPSQTVAGAVEMVGAAAGVYQQPQRAQINWGSNY